jgi:hypothetical protein
MFDTTIAGIPCKVDLIDSHYNKPQPWNDASSDDFYGGWDLEWEVLDRKGYKADWLSKKMTAYDINHIESEIIERLKSEEY